MSTHVTQTSAAGDRHHEAPPRQPHPPGSPSERARQSEPQPSAPLSWQEPQPNKPEPKQRESRTRPAWNASISHPQQRCGRSAPVPVHCLKSLGKLISPECVLPRLKKRTWPPHVSLSSSGAPNAAPDSELDQSVDCIFYGPTTAPSHFGNTAARSRSPEVNTTKGER